MYKAYEQNKLSLLKDKRSIEIIQKAKKFGIEVFDNEVLASSLFNLELTDEFDKDEFEEFLKVLRACEDAISKAQMSS